MWEAIISDKHSITILMTKNRTCSPDKISMARADQLGRIIQISKRLHVMTMSGPQFDYLCVEFAEWVAELGLGRLFWDNDLQTSDPERGLR